MQWNIICDFDGTIALRDTTDLVLSAFARPEWETIEQEWKKGAIGSAECMRRQVELIEAGLPEIDALLRTVEIDPYFIEFADFCAEHDLPLLVASDGVDYFIHRILTRYGLAHLPVRANMLVAKNDGGFTLDFPHMQAGCASQAGHCKCVVATTSRRRNILIGDGQSDFCLAHQADLVIAKSRLLDYCRKEKLRHVGFSDFSQVQAMIARLIIAPQTEKPAAADGLVLAATL